MADETTPAPRTGDTIVIGADGTATNIDQEARDKAAAEASKANARKTKTASTAAEGEGAPAPKLD
ncbi:hypothetical protein DXH95_03090 [Sphingorhabdus pulchriflava]|uniref:Uncharacterized protein n=1 Tax=Sphingorhabdus pulchriflava TaxID=2292257 RepID=A0A371BFP6_9SPHN|nr:hypothetical protein [Sphingorhabdus pulchriflava]RDV06426.1 hypothetical protein DXH95_03090 [Sphingorhabdus pulchriflava]